MSDDTGDLTRLGAEIRKARKRLDMTQEAVSTAAAVSKGFLSDVENGKRSISVLRLARIARVLGESLDVLVYGVPSSVNADLSSRLAAVESRMREIETQLAERDRDASLWRDRDRAVRRACAAE